MKYGGIISAKLLMNGDWDDITFDFDKNIIYYLGKELDVRDYGDMSSTIEHYITPIKRLKKHII